MHILLISEFFPSLTKPVFSGGVEARCYYIAKSISKKHSVTVISRRKTGEKAKEIEGNLTIHRLGQPVNSAAATIGSLFSRGLFVIQSFFVGLRMKADIVEGSNYVTFFPAYWLALIKRIPKVAYYPDVLVGQWQKQFGLVLGFIGEICEKIMARLSWSGYITTADAVKKRMRGLKINPSRIHLIPCGVDCESLGKIQAKTTKTPHLSLIVISRLLGYKRVDWAVRLVSQLQTQFPEIKLTIIGEGPEKNALLRLIQKLHLEKHITFRSKLTINTLYKQLASSWLLIHPSLVEGFGIVLAEAAALGTPFVAADIPTSIMLEKHLASGKTFKQRKFNDLVEKSQNILSNKQVYEELKNLGIDKVSMYDWKTIADRTIELYQSLVKKTIV